MHRCTLLHVEDDDGAAFLFRLALEEASFTGSVYRVSDGEEALRFLRKADVYQSARTPKVVVLDLNLPKRDGWFVLAETQKDSALYSIPVVILSTAPAQENEQRALACGARAYFEKGEDLDALMRQAVTICDLFQLVDSSDALASSSGAVGA